MPLVGRWRQSRRGVWSMKERQYWTSNSSHLDLCLSYRGKHAWIQGYKRLFWCHFFICKCIVVSKHQIQVSMVGWLDLESNLPMLDSEKNDRPVTVPWTLWNWKPSTGNSSFLKWHDDWYTPKVSIALHLRTNSRLGCSENHVQKIPIQKTLSNNLLGSRTCLSNADFQVEVFPVNLCSTWSTVIILALMQLDICICVGQVVFLSLEVLVLYLRSKPS